MADRIDRDFIDLQHALAGQYSLERELGRGGMGIVYLAREVELDRLVAIKVLPSPLAERADIRDRFLREARMAASLSHPHIVPIYRVGEAGGFVFFVMAYVNGETLGERLRTRGPLPAAAATRLLREVAWALSYAHVRGIVHRDVKPDNILIEHDTGRALVTDFGIARGAEETRISDPGRVMGTVHFMSPEQASSEALDGRSDLYSLGVVAYLALSGKLPFDAPSMPALMIKQVTDPAPALASTTPAIPGQLAAIVDRLLHKNPAERFESGEALAEALDAANAPARSKLPMGLRVWAQAHHPLRGLYAAWSTFFTIGFISQLRSNRHGFDYVRDLVLIAAIGSAPLIPITIFHMRKTYQALSAGYTLRDLRAALATWQQEKRDELAFEFGVEEPRWARWIRNATYVLIPSLLYTFLFVRFPNTLWSKLFIVGSVGGTIATVTVGSALGVAFVPNGVRSRWVGAIRSAFWNSRLGSWMSKMLTPANRTATAAIDYRPTEMALGVAVEDLYRALPKEYREHVPELPNIVEGLEAHAAAARARVDEIDAMIALGSAPAELASARDRSKRKLTESVTALEAIRLALLRLHGGAADLTSMTTVLDAARNLGEELERLNQAQRDVEAVRPLAFDLRPHTPT
jgi:serine/threonine-protein kinase